MICRDEEKWKDCGFVIFEQSLLFNEIVKYKWIKIIKKVTVLIDNLTVFIQPLTLYVSPAAL